MVYRLARLPFTQEERVRLSLGVSLLAALVLAAPAGATIVPGRGMAGVRVGMTRAQVVAVLGAPKREVNGSDDFGTNVKLTYASHGGLTLTLRPSGGSGTTRVFSVLTKRGVERTAQGIGVGSAESTLRRRLSGEHCETLSGFHHCYLGSFTAGKVVTDFRISRSSHRVTSVVVARVLD